MTQLSQNDAGRELQRRSLRRDYHTSITSKHSRDFLLNDLTAHRIAWGHDTFVNIKPNCFRSGNCRRNSSHPTSGGAAVLLRQDTQAFLEHCPETPYPKWVFQLCQHDS